jgi:hypothetical protein
MAFRYGTKFRRFFAQAVSADPHDRRTLIERVLPPAEGGKRSLRLRTFADCDAAPRAIVAAWLADELTAEEAGDLLQQVANEQEKDTKQPRACQFPPWREVADGRSAASAPPALVNINENTSATPDPRRFGTGEANGQRPVELDKNPLLRGRCVATRATDETTENKQTTSK